MEAQPSRGCHPDGTIDSHRLPFMPVRQEQMWELGVFARTSEKLQGPCANLTGLQFRLSVSV